MRKLLILLVILIGVLSINAQSKSKFDYVPVFQLGTTPYYVDSTSLQILKNKNKVFWFMFPFEGVLAFGSAEVSCTTRQLRMRESFFLIKGYESKRSKELSPWMPNDDPIALNYVNFACGKIQYKDLS